MKALYTIALTVGLLLTTAAANAQGVTMRAHIPFDFVVGDQALPAGDYLVQPQLSGSAILTMRSSDGNRAASAITYSYGGGRPWEKTELVFHHVAQSYILAQVQVQGFSEGRQLPKNRAEAEAETQLGQKADNVVVLAQLVNR
jgi:hypothetical protein